MANGWIKCDGSIEQDFQLHVFCGSASSKIKGRILSAGLALMKVVALDSERVGMAYLDLSMYDGAF